MRDLQTEVGTARRVRMNVRRAPDGPAHRMTCTDHTGSRPQNDHHSRQVKEAPGEGDAAYLRPAAGALLFLWLLLHMLDDAQEVVSHLMLL